jgi:HSP20 family protein
MLPSILRRNRPATPTVSFPHQAEDVFDRFLDFWNGNGWNATSETAAYPVDIREQDGQILVDAELPGFQKDEVKVTLERGVLSIRAEHREEKKEEGTEYLNERSYRRIQRAFTLPAEVDESKVEADLKDGVLHLTLQKSKESAARQIDIK